MPLPYGSIRDKGFYIRTLFFPLPRMLELYTATVQIFPYAGPAYTHSYEYLVSTKQRSGLSVDTARPQKNG